MSTLKCTFSIIDWKKKKKKDNSISTGDGKDMDWKPYGCTSCGGRWSAWGRRRPRAPARGRAPQACSGHFRCWRRHLDPLPRWCHQPALSHTPGDALARPRKCPPAAQDTPHSSWQRRPALRRGDENRVKEMTFAIEFPPPQIDFWNGFLRNICTTQRWKWAPLLNPLNWSTTLLCIKRHGDPNFVLLFGSNLAAFGQITSALKKGPKKMYKKFYLIQIKFVMSWGINGWAQSNTSNLFFPLVKYNTMI